MEAAYPCPTSPAEETDQLVCEDLDRRAGSIWVTRKLIRYLGNLLRGPVDEEGNLKAAALTVGIKLDLEAEVHLSARVRGDILVGLY